jgi:uncharacterized protein YdaU (DUF1376 family)
VNFYKHHIGDFAQATAHLSFVEDAAYSRLLRKYYAEEKAITADLKAVQRLIGARTKEEREAVETVLNEFFTEEEDGWHNKRADAELAKANAQADTNRRIAEEREARRKARIAANESLHESSSVREPSQTPDTRHQTPFNSEEDKSSSSLRVEPRKPRPAKRCPEDFDPGPEGLQWAAEHAPGVDVRAETAKLRDHTFATARSDWLATWRNWIRKAAEAAPTRAPNPRNGEPAEPEWRRLQRERNEAFLGPAAQRRTSQNVIDLEPSDATPRLVG